MYYTLTEIKQKVMGIKLFLFDTFSGLMRVLLQSYYRHMRADLTFKMTILTKIYIYILNISRATHSIQNAIQYE